MLKVATPSQMRGIDNAAIEEHRIPGITLMENAAGCVAAQAVKMLEEKIKGALITVAAGKGNNGGDAFAAARLLAGRGALVCVYLTAREDEIRGDARTNLDRLRVCPGVTIRRLEEDENGENGKPAVRAYADLWESLTCDLEKCALIIDGIFGTGFSGEIQGVYAEVIDKITASEKPVLSIDIPSGVDGATGKIAASHICADCTVTFALLKTGLLLYPGCLCAGKIVIADIGIPQEAVDKAGLSVYTAEDADIMPLLPVRRVNSNKSDYGRVLLITGSTGMTGAGSLAGRAALRAGAGLVYLGVPASLSHIYEIAVPETISIPLDDGGTGKFVAGADIYGDIARLMPKMDVTAAGPGMSQDPDIIELTEFLTGCVSGEGIDININSGISSSSNSGISSSSNSCISGRGRSKPLILDADALNCIAQRRQKLKSGHGPLLVTPHPGEMSRLTGLSIGEIQGDRIGTALKCAAEWNAVVLLKGFRTIVASPDGKTYINLTGNAGMASAGAGDVLTGIISGLAGQYAAADPGGGSELQKRQTLWLYNAAVTGAYLHGLAGDIAVKRFGQHGMKAGDIIEYLPPAFIRVTGDSDNKQIPDEDRTVMKDCRGPDGSCIFEKISAEAPAEIQRQTAEVKHRGRAWAEIDIDNLAHNIRVIREITGPKTEITAVVKANAYGHGAVRIAREALKNGVSMLATATLDEALELRDEGIEAPILVMSYTPTYRAGEIVKNDITQAVFRMDMAEAISAASAAAGKITDIHIKTDTGMSRIGFNSEDPGTPASIAEIAGMPGIRIGGIYTHLAVADEDDESFTRLQLKRFNILCGRLDRIGIKIPLRHAANSAAAIRYPEARLDMVRIGIALYGLDPFKGAGKVCPFGGLKPVMSLSTEVAYVKEIEKGDSVSYGRKFTASRRSRIVTLPIGYADGYPRLLSGRGRVLIKGVSAPLAGTVCMDQCMADTTDIKADIKSGDTVVLIGRQGEAGISMEELAEDIGTINYEIACMIGKRVERVYIKEKNRSGGGLS
ncbi:MAG: alanine racemase [Eubacteriales bacterium]|nr:alanine racemase [Eubacteriales bacterium]